MDLERAVITLKRAVAKDGQGRWYLKDTKTHQQRRVALDPLTVSVLAAQWERYRERCTVLGVPLRDDALVSTPALALSRITMAAANERARRCPSTVSGVVSGWLHAVKPGPLHGRLEATFADVKVGHACGPALLGELVAAPANPGCGSGELGVRCLALVLRFRALVGGEVVGAEAAVSEEAGPDLHPGQGGLQPRGVPRRQLEALDEEPLSLLGADLGRLLDVRIHHLGEPFGVDRVGVDRVELGNDAAQHGTQHVCGQPRDGLAAHQALRQGGLSYPRWTTDKVEDAAGHDRHCRAGQASRRGCYSTT